MIAESSGRIKLVELELMPFETLLRYSRGSRSGSVGIGVKIEGEETSKRTALTAQMTVTIAGEEMLAFGNREWRAF